MKQVFWILERNKVQLEFYLDAFLIYDIFYFILFFFTEWNIAPKQKKEEIWKCRAVQ